MIDKDDLVKWLSKMDKKVGRKIIVVAIGGTAMTLLGLKPSTMDIDFCVDMKDKKDFEKALDNSFKVDIFVDGFIFSEQLPDDYIDKSKEIIKMKNITLKALNPVDIIITKTARLNARDEEDISVLSKYVDKEELVNRFDDVVKTFAGKEKDFRYHFDIILKRFFK